MGQPRLSATGILESAGDDLSQAGLTQYMQDVIFVTWGAQMVSLVWSKGWWIYGTVSACLAVFFPFQHCDCDIHCVFQIPAFALYKILKLASPLLFSSLSAPKDTRTLEERKAYQLQLSKDRLSKRQQKVYARYDKGDKRVQMVEKKQ